MINLIFGNNLDQIFDKNSADMIIADYIYENTNFQWVDKYLNYLKTGGIFIVITDYHSVAEIKVHIQKIFPINLLNWLIWKNEFGNFKKDRFRQCHDDILIFRKGFTHRFDANKVQIPKVTANSRGLNPSGRITKIATSVITDICLTTIAKERLQDDTGKNIRWQKPIELYRRIMSPFLIENNLIIDPFMGTGTAGIVAKELNCKYIGIECDKIPFDLAKKTGYYEISEHRHRNDGPRSEETRHFGSRNHRLRFKRGRALATIVYCYR